MIRSLHITLSDTEIQKTDLAGGDKIRWLTDYAPKWEKEIKSCTESYSSPGNESGIWRSELTVVSDGEGGS
jgi:hypothetical protein